MSKQTALYVMLAGIAVSLYDMATDGSLYGLKKDGTDGPLKGLSWKVYTSGTAPNTKDWHVSVSDAVAVAGAWFYFR